MTIKPIAAFITPHGFGHAARATGVLEEVRRRNPEQPLKLFTTVPEHFFAESLDSFEYYQTMCDIGIIQHDALHCDVESTQKRLDEFLPFAETLLERLAEQVKDCSAVLADISPLGIAVAERAGIPSLLVENFTWDWIYQGHEKLHRHAGLLAEIFTRATRRIQAEPVCFHVEGCLSCPSIFRRIRRSPKEVREKLGIGNRKMILISMGGIGYPLEQLLPFDSHPDLFFLLAGQQREEFITDNCLALTNSGEWYHPDIIGAADLVVCKSGYSTVAECVQGGTRIMAVDREGFAETSVLSRFIEKRLNGTIINEAQFADGSWLETAKKVLQIPRPAPAETNGAGIVADILLGL